MKEEWKVYIKSVPGRGDEVIKTLEDLGAKNSFDYEGNKLEALYYIWHDGSIHVESTDNEYGWIIMDNYYEIKLPELWKDEDILYSYDLRKYVVCSNNSNKWGEQIAYITVSQGGSITTFESFLTRSYHLATPQEIVQFHELLHKHGKDWDAEKKELVDWRWKPKKGDGYFYINHYVEVIVTTWMDDYDDQSHYNAGNCFRTHEEAKVAAEKIKKLLKAES